VSVATTGTLVLPRAGGGFAPCWVDVAALAAVGGCALAFGAWRLRGHAIAPLGDPYLAASLEYGRS
jgi:hypothetical protein